VSGPSGPSGLSGVSGPSRPSGLSGVSGPSEGLVLAALDEGMYLADLVYLADLDEVQIFVLSDIYPIWCS